MAHWNPYYNGSNHIYQEQNPQINYTGVPFQQLAYNDYYIPNVTSYDTNSTDFSSRANYIDSSDYSGNVIPDSTNYNLSGINLSDYTDGTNRNANRSSHNTTDYTKGSNRTTSGSNRNTDGSSRNASGSNRNTSRIDYNMGVLNYSNISDCVPNTPSYNTNASRYDPNTSRYNPNSSDFNASAYNTSASDFNTNIYNTNALGYNTNASNFKTSNSGFNITTLDYNTKTLDYDTSVSNYNTKASDYKLKTSSRGTNDAIPSNYKINSSSMKAVEFNPNGQSYIKNTSKFDIKNKSSRVQAVQQVDSTQNPHDLSTYVSNLTPTATEFTPSTSWQKPILSQTFNSSSYKGPVKQAKKNVEKNSDALNDEKKSGNFMRFTNRKYNDKYKPNDKFKNGSYKRNRDESSQNSSESSSYNNLQRDYYSNKNNRYKNYGETVYNRNYQEKNERSGGEGNGYSDSYRNNSKYTYRSNYKDDSKYENWRSNTRSMPLKDKSTENVQLKNNDKVDYQDRVRSLCDRKFYKDKKLEDDDISQRDRLMEQVNKGTLECLVCCETIRHADKTWSCSKCYHIFHLRCSLKWAKASKDDNGWRCPACQHISTELPNNYTCYCGQVLDPVYRSGDTAHSCGNVCGRIGVKPGCTHKCRLLCHPGPCPTCENLVSKVCNCGATKQMVKCSSNIPLVCKSVCNKILNCGVHRCQKICHTKECADCEETIHQECFCGKLSRTVSCTEDQVEIRNYSCEKICKKSLLCGNHNCKEVCHPGDCAPCERSVDVVKTCPCSKTELKETRASCLDPIPCCDKICGKEYICGMPSNPHRCQSVCHEGVCPVCNLTSLVQCRCGHMSCEIPCSTLVSKADDARCKKKCTKKRSCAKHKCNQYCCIDIEHVCPLPCNRMLSCGQHRCELTCHKGRCPPCWRTSFEELYCECGASVIYPPVTCGTKRPNCTRPCSRQHECSHDVLHTCHSLPECPPCTVFTVKWCHGGHEKRSTIPCHQKDFSCGLPCNKDLSCGRHKCILPCHSGSCLREGQNCTQSCTVARETCGHPCGLPCHDPPCQESPCKEIVKVTCECGLRSTQRACVDMAGDYQRITNSMLASKMADMQLGHSIDIADIIGTTRKQVLKTLECNNECKLIERNRRLAIGLQIRNPDLSAKLTPKYSDFMKQWAKKNPVFVQMVHDKLTELVQLAKQSKQKSRSYSFESMNRDKRHLIHEYCEHFGCESAAYDQEPNRNVVATAVGDKAWLPSLSVLELLQRESGQRKVPGPILNRPLNLSSSSNNSQSVSLKISSAKVTSITASLSNTLQQRSKTPEGETIDYFDYNPTK